MRLTLLVAVATQALDANPITKVVSLIREMKTELEHDGEQEQNVYDKYACWCEKTSASKAKAIDDAKELVDSLADKVRESKGLAASLAGKLATVHASLAQAIEDQETATKAREAEREAFAKEDEKLADAIDQVTKAGGELDSPGAKAKLLAITSKLQAISRSPRLSALQTLEASAPLAVKQAKGIVADMKETFEGNRAANQKVEAEKVRLYKELMLAKGKEIDQARKLVREYEEEVADARQTAARTVESREDTLEQIAADEKFFTDTVASCKEKASDHTEQVKLRQAELDGVYEAINVLESPEARGLLSAATSNFVQVSMTSRNARATAVGALREQASRSQLVSSVLAMVNSGVSFQDVQDKIDDMLKVLKQKEEQDVKDKDECVAKTNSNLRKADTLSAAVGRIQKRLDGARHLQADIEAAIEAQQAKQDEQQDLISEAETDRDEAHRRYESNLKDDEDAVTVLGKAIKAMEPTPALLQQRGSRALVSKANSVVELLKHIQTNLEKEIEQEKQQEEDDAAAYEKQEEDNTATLDAIKQRKSDLSKDLSETRSDAESEEQDLTNEEDRKGKVTTLLEDIKPGCDWLLSNYDKRRKQRQEETQGLYTAKEILGGSMSPSAAAGFLQK